MAGAGLKHNIIVSNLSGHIGAFLIGRNFRLLLSDRRVSTPTLEVYLYPDALIAYGESQLENDQLDTLLNPSVSFEILSTSTRSSYKDRKFFFYRQIPSLQACITVDSLKNIYSWAANKRMLPGSLKTLIPVPCLHRSLILPSPWKIPIRK
ncbi:MAG: Uma2 family endonuclease [Bacteroidota bacterium]